MKLHDNKNTSLKSSRLVAVQDPEPVPRQIVVRNLELLLDFGPAPKMILTYKDLEKMEADRAKLDAVLDPPPPKEIEVAK